MRGHVGTVTRGQARKREGARWHGDTWARADDERIGGSERDSANVQIGLRPVQKCKGVE
jgi:hypothetical protein